ncbi:MAG: serine hydrolase [Thermomicrobiales bacterium]
MRYHNRGVNLTLLMTVMLALLALPSPVTATTTADWTEFDRAFSRAAPSSGFLAAEIVNGACQPVHGVREERRLAVASAIKLYVLAELARQVADGDASWDELYPIQDELKSLPSGSMAFLSEGSRHPLRKYAEHMIGESDNTATDHLIARLGRESIEAHLTAFGHGAPELNRPFLTTREVFTFRVGLSSDAIAAYLAAPEAERREMLATDVDSYPLLDKGWGDWVSPEWAESVEWFASPLELCTVLAYLSNVSKQPGLEPVEDILMQNRGGNINPRDWPEAGFKGGFEAGVYNMTWLLKRQDGRVFVLTSGFNDPVNYIDQGTTGILALRAADLLADSR